MALITCEECGREISSRASSCPHCGCPNGDEFRDVKTVETSIVDLPSDEALIKLREGSDYKPISRSPIDTPMPQAQQTRVVVNHNGCGAGCGNGCLFVFLVVIVIIIIVSLAQ